MDSLPGNEEGSFCDSSDYRNSAAHVHSFFDHNLNRGRHNHVRARTKLYHPKTLATFYPLALPLPTNNPARQNSGDLGTLDGQVRPANCEGILLVQQARPGVGSHQKLAALVRDFRDFTADWRTVDVNVER